LRSLIFAVFIVLFQSGWSLGAAKGSLTPKVLKEMKQANISLASCRKEAVDSLKADRPASARAIRSALTVCQERFPAANLYSECKKAAIKKAGDNRNLLKKHIKTCRQLMAESSFDPKDLVPFGQFQDKVFFAGIGLNASLPIRALTLPNFDCEAPREFLQRPRDADIFFGNHINVFSPFSDMEGRQLVQTLQLPRLLPKGGLFVEGLGKTFGTPSKNQIYTYFPSAPCHFNGNLGENYSGLSLYYLLDPRSSRVVPYFGTAYYQEYQNVLNTEQLETAVLQRLGKAFKVIHRRNSQILISSDAITRFDDEGDPLNLCQAPRKHNLLAIIKTRGKDSSKPEYLLLANIVKLCEYGDQVSRHFIDK
jgi:hypothetical protein